MKQKRLTKDELFLIHLQEEAKKLGDPYHPIGRYQIGQLIGQNDKSVDNMVRMLAQTNFIKKADGNSVYITKQGEELIRNII